MKLKKLVKKLRSFMHVYVYDEINNNLLISNNAVTLLKTAPDSVMNCNVIRITEAENDSIHVTVGV